MTTSFTERTSYRPRVGVPWRTAAEELAHKRAYYDSYLNAIREAGGDAVEVSLGLPDEALRKLAESLDAVLLPGSPADVNPADYGAARNKLTAEADERRERTDRALLDHAFASGKPVLGICYGTQLLNVYLGGNLVQDIPSELVTKIQHDHEDHEPDARHAVLIEPRDGDNGESHYLAEIAAQVRGPNRGDGRGGANARRPAEFQVNSSHHQSIRDAASGLRVTAKAPDGVVEAVEWTGSSPWIVGVQWHPERMAGDNLAGALFRALLSQALIARNPAGGKRA